MTTSETQEWRIKELEREVDELKERDRQYWMWGVRFLGFLVVTMAGVIWTYLGDIIK